MKGQVEVEIDELVLHGFDPMYRHAVAARLTAELTRLLERCDSTAIGSRPSVPLVDGGSFAVPHHGHSASLGDGVARAVARAVTGR